MRMTFVFIFVCAYILSFGQYAFSIEGKTPHLFNNKKIYLCVWDAKSAHGRKLDSTLIRNSAFSFAGYINTLAENAVLYTTQAHDNYNFVIDTGVNVLTVHEVERGAPLYKNKLSNTEIVNSLSNHIYRQIENLSNHYYQTKGRPSPKNKNIIELSETDRAGLKEKELLILKQNPTAFYSLVHLNRIAGSLATTEQSETYHTFTNEIKSSPLGIDFNERLLIRQETEMGSTAKIFTAKTNTDSSFASTSLNGTAYLLVFGATWCIPCKERLPLLSQLYRRHRSKGLEIVYVNLDEMTQKWKNQIIKDKMEWINVSESVQWKDSKISKLFGVTTIPFLPAY